MPTTTTTLHPTPSSSSPIDRPPPAWALHGVDLARPPEELRPLLELLPHGSKRLRSPHGRVPRIDVPFPRLTRIDNRHRGLYLLAWAATTPLEQASHYHLARAVCRAIERLYGHSMAPDDPLIASACIATVQMIDAKLPLSLEANEAIDALAAIDPDHPRMSGYSSGLRDALRAIASLLRAAITAAAGPSSDIPVATTPPPAGTREEAEETAPPTPPSPAIGSSEVENDPTPPTRGALPAPPLAALRAQAQHLDVGRASALHPSELQLALQAIADEGDALARAIVAITLLVGPAARDPDEWYVARTPDEIDLTRVHSWLVLEPLSICLANRINPSLPRAKRDSDLVASDRITLPLDLDLYGMPDLAAWATPRIGVPLVTRGELVQVDRQLRRIRERCDVPLTRARLADVMAQQFRLSAGDEIPLAYLSCQPIDTRLTARLSYRSVSLDQMQTVWVEGQRARQRLLGNPVDDLATRLPAAPIGRVGSLFCPAPAAVRDWVARLHAPIAMPLRGQPTSARLVEWHNAYVLYVLQFLQWSIGTRPTGRGVLSAQPDDRGYVVVADKTRDDLRLLPWCPMAYAQVVEYARHRAWLVPRLRLAMPPAWFTLRLVGTKVRAVPLMPKTLHLLSRSPFTANAHRHAFATAMGEAHWADHRIAQWLGQASLGDEPGAAYAGHDPRWQAHELADIDAYLIRHGWTVVKGMGHG